MLAHFRSAYGNDVTPEQRLDFVVCDSKPGNDQFYHGPQQHPGLIRPIPGRPNPDSAPPIPGPKPTYYKDLTNEPSRAQRQLFPPQSHPVQYYDNQQQQQPRAPALPPPQHFSTFGYSSFSGGPNKTIKPLRKIKYPTCLMFSILTVFFSICSSSGRS